MSAERSRRGSNRYLEGLAQGRLARNLLPADAPLSPEQTAWLGGFLAGLFEGGEARGDLESGEHSDLDGRVKGGAQRGSLRGASVAAHGAEGDSGARAPSAPSGYSRDNPFAAQLVRVDPLPSRSRPDAWLVGATTEGHRVDYEAGDRIGISRQNDPDRVRDLLRRLAARGQEEVTTPRGTGPAWRALLEEVDIEVPTLALVELLADVAQDREERRSLDACLYGLPEGSTVAGLLRRYPSARPRIAEVVATLGAIEPTLHAVASSPLAVPDGVELVVGGAEPAGGDPGPAGRLVADLAAMRLRRGDWLPIFVEPRPELHLPEDPTTPIVFVGTGTAATTFRALMEHRFLSRANGRNWVFLLGEETAVDVLHRPDFDRWVEGRVLTRFEATIGGPAELLDRLVAHGDMLTRWLLDQSHVYIDADPSTTVLVERTLASLLERHARLAPDAARARLAERRGPRGRAA